MKEETEDSCVLISKKEYEELKQQAEANKPDYLYIQINNGLLTKKILLVIRTGVTSYKGTLRMVKNVYQKILSPNKQVFAIWNQTPNHEEIQKLFEEWEAEFIQEFKIKKFYAHRYNDNLAYLVAKGNHVIKDDKRFNEFISEIVSDLESGK